jgi:hypothetical protein
MPELRDIQRQRGHKDKDQKGSSLTRCEAPFHSHTVFCFLPGFSEFIEPEAEEFGGLFTIQWQPDGGLSRAQSVLADRV